MLDCRRYLAAQTGVLLMTLKDPSPERRANLKKSLSAAKLEIEKTISRVDTAQPHELAEIQGAAKIAAAFVDFSTNHGC
jgi:hypothetical protein